MFSAQKFGGVAVGNPLEPQKDQSAARSHRQHFIGRLLHKNALKIAEHFRIVRERLDFEFAADPLRFENLPHVEFIGHNFPPNSFVTSLRIFACVRSLSSSLRMTAMFSSFPKRSNAAK